MKKNLILPIILSALMGCNNKAKADDKNLEIIKHACLNFPITQKQWVNCDCFVDRFYSKLNDTQKEFLKCAYAPILYNSGKVDFCPPFTTDIYHDDKNNVFKYVQTELGMKTYLSIVVPFGTALGSCAGEEQKARREKYEASGGIVYDKCEWTDNFECKRIYRCLNKDCSSKEYLK